MLTIGYGFDNIARARRGTRTSAFQPALWDLAR